MAMTTPKNVLPKFVLYAFLAIGIIPKLISLLFRTFHLPDYTGLDSDYLWLSRNPICHRKSPELVRKALPSVVKYQDLVSICDGWGITEDSTSECAVCLCEFDEEDEIRPLIECNHMFHRSCLDRWMSHYKFTCPLCRTPFIKNNMFQEIKTRL